MSRTEKPRDVHQQEFRCFETHRVSLFPFPEQARYEVEVPTVTPLRRLQFK
jgi:hypothetical protein